MPIVEQYEDASRAGSEADEVNGMRSAEATFDEMAKDGSTERSDGEPSCQCSKSTRGMPDRRRRCMHASSQFEIVLYHEYKNDSAGTDKASATVTISTGYQCATSRYQNAFFATETTVWTRPPDVRSG